MIRPDVLERLQCPENRLPLALADDALLARVNHLIAYGKLKSRSGEPFQQRLDAGLLRSDGAVLYPVIVGIPHLTLDQAIDLAQLPIVAP